MPHRPGTRISRSRLEHFDRLAVIHMHEFRADDALEFRDQPLLDALVEEGEIFPVSRSVTPRRCISAELRPAPHRPKDGERDLRLHHPELGEVAAGVSSSRRGRSGRTYKLGQRQAIGLEIELPRDRQERFAAEELLREIHLAHRRGRLCKIEDQDPNKAPAPSASAGGKFGVYDPEIPLLVEDPVYRLREA